MPNPNQSTYLLAAEPVEFVKADADSVRTFSGIANSGKPFKHFGQPAIIDLSDVKYKDKTPVLDTHNRSHRCGVAKLSVKNNQLLVTGRLLTNQYGQEIAADADEGFPWELSVHANPSSVTEVLPGQTVEVNGQTITGPIDILHGSSIREVSFTPTGIDQQTNATVLSDEAKPNSTMENTMTEKEMLAKLKELEDKLTASEDEKAKLKEKISELEAAGKKASTDAKLSDAGFKKGEDGKYQGISDATYSVLLSADADAAAAMIADLTPKTDKTIPDVLLTDQGAQQAQQGQHGGVQLSDNPLLNDAKARGTQEKKYV